MLYAQTVANRIEHELGMATQNEQIFPDGISTTDELLVMFTPSPTYPPGAPWSHHLHD